MTTLDSAGPLLETKLYVPRLRRGLVARPRLSERMNRGAESRLTLISAPPGFGKTTLLAEWLAAVPPADGRSVAWLSLDPGDNEAAPFWTYLVAALQTVAPGVGARALSLLQGPQPPPIESVLATLLNELGAVPTDVVLVLDDYHVINAPDIGDGMAFLLEHLPPRVHLVIATRADPALPLSGLRARGELVEIRASDLRFTPEEGAAYLNEAMGLDLAAGDVAALEGRTEGWIAALQLAALSIQGRDDVAGFIAGFAGDDRYIVDYLVEEVLHRQPEQVRSFLLETSILARLTGPLCDAVTGQDGGKAMLESLDRGNLFLVPLDDRRQWYRYHHLFADVLRARLLDEGPELAPELHARACEWYEEHRDRSEAIRHAMAGGDLARAADLVELAIPAMNRSQQSAKLRQWLESLPDEMVRARPVLCVAYATTLLEGGRVEGVEARLRDAERWLDTMADGRAGPRAPSTAMVVVDEEAFRGLPGWIALYRGAQAMAVGDVAGTITHAQRTLDLVGEDDHHRRGAAAGLLGLAAWTTGDLEAAHRSYAECVASMQKAEQVSTVIGCAIVQADIRIAQGRLRDAMRTYERGLRLATEHGAPALRGAADMHTGMSELFRERNDLETAAQHLLVSRELGEENGLSQNPYRSRVAAARIRQAQGDLDGALELLDEADRLYASDFSPDVRPVAAVKARVWIAQGNLSAAWGWAQEHGLTAADELSYLHEFEHATLARLLLAQGTRDRADDRIAAAIELTERLLAAAEHGGRSGSAIDILVVQALARHAGDNVTGALDSLARAVALAEPEGYVRVFIDEGPPMAALLKLAAKDRKAPRYVRRLVGAVVSAEGRASVEQPLIEPLSERELEVLRLLGGELGGPDIARELVVSPNTVRTHTKSIYAKLGVNSRRAAVRRAAELGLLSRTRDRRPNS